MQIVGEGTHSDLSCPWAQSRMLTPRDQRSQKMTWLNEIKPRPPAPAPRKGDPWSGGWSWGPWRGPGRTAGLVSSRLGWADVRAHCGIGSLWGEVT